MFDVAVVGLGPVGAVAAHLLAKEALSVIAIEPSRKPYDKPRAIGIDHESLRVLQNIGIAERVTLGDYATTEYRSAAGQVLRRVRAQAEPHPLAWPPSATFIQPELEGKLRESLSERANLKTRLGAGVVDIVSSDEHVALTLENEGGRQESVDARYVVACDGARGVTRTRLGIGLEDLVFDEPWLVVDALIENDYARLPDLTIQLCDPARPTTFICGPGKLRRWEFMLLPDEDAAEMVDPARVNALVSDWIDPQHVRIWRASTYRFHALVAERWRKGRVFLAGDAAHQTPPFMAQGLNQGMRDVANLCWKIGQVVHGAATPRILDTYEQERRPNVCAVIEQTKSLGRIICERDQNRAEERNRQMLAAMAAGQGEFVRQDLLPPILDGLLLSRFRRTAVSPPEGTSFPQPWLQTSIGRRRMDDVLPNAFLMLVPSDYRPDQSALELARTHNIIFFALDTAVSPEVIAVRETEGVLSAWMQRFDVTVALVRPDHVVFGADASADGVLQLLDALVGTLGTDTFAAPKTRAETGQ